MPFSTIIGSAEEAQLTTKALRLNGNSSREELNGSTRGGAGFEMSTGAMRPHKQPRTENGGAGTCPLPNHCLDQTAASFGWTVEAAAGQALRYGLENDLISATE